MRKLFVALALLLGVTFFIVRLSEVEAVIGTLRRGDWRFILLAVIAEAAVVLNLAASFRSIYQALGIEERIERLLLIATAANFINVVAPSGGVGGITLFLAEARRSGYSSARAAVATVLYVFFEYVGLLSILALGLAVLFRRNHLTAAELIASAILFLLACVLALLIVLGMAAPHGLARVLAWMARAINFVFRPFIHREYLSVTRAYSFAQEAASGLHVIRSQPENLLMPAVLSLSSKALLITVLFLVFLGFGVPFSVGTLIAGFSIGYLFLIVSPTPAGIGIVEGALALTLGSLNVPLGAATVIALAYRGITFWLPWFFGMIAFRWLTKSGAKFGSLDLKQDME